jgi:ferritin-like metal-binding protein YciE
VEHYEIAGYGTARAHAQQLGYANAARLLQLTLSEESAANEKLSQIAEASVNVSAAQKHNGKSSVDLMGSRH